MPFVATSLSSAEQGSLSAPELDLLLLVHKFVLLRFFRETQTLTESRIAIGNPSRFWRHRGAAVLKALRNCMEDLELVVSVADGLFGSPIPRVRHHTNIPQELSRATSVLEKREMLWGTLMRVCCVWMDYNDSLSEIPGHRESQLRTLYTLGLIHDYLEACADEDE